MKKINKNDLSLNKETVSSISDNVNSDMPQTRQVTNCLDCRTIYTCQTKCEQFSCVGCEEATFQSNCMCLSDNVPCESDGCNPTASQALCCELPPDVTNNCEYNSLKVDECQDTNACTIAPVETMAAGENPCLTGDECPVIRTVNCDQ